MTTPDERTRSLIVAGEVLTRIRNGELTLEEARDQAHGVLRHYPDKAVIQIVGYQEGERKTAAPWLVRVDE